MRILDRSVYLGPNLYAHFPVIRLELDLGELEPGRRAKLGGSFVDALLEALPASPSTAARTSEPGGFVRRMTEDEGTWLGHVLEHVAIELQNLAGDAVTFGKTRSAGAPGRYHVVYEYEEARSAEAAGELALRLLASLLPEPSCGRRARSRTFDLPTERDESDPLRAAPRARALDRLAGARRRGARHPVAAAQRPLAGAARPRQVPEAHPGDGHRTRRRTSRSRSPRTRRRPTASSATSACRCRASDWCARRSDAVRGGRAARLPGRGQAARRQPRPRRLDRPATTPSRCATASSGRASISRIGDRRDLPRPASTTACWSSTAS